MAVFQMCGGCHSYAWGSLKKMAKLCLSLIMNIFSVHLVDFHSLSSTCTHRLINDSSMSSHSHLLLTNPHIHSLSHYSDLLTLKLVSLVGTNSAIFMSIIHTTHISLTDNSQVEVWGVKTKPHLLHTQLPTCTR